MNIKIYETDKVLEKDDNNGVKQLIDVVSDIIEDKLNQTEKQEECIFCRSLLHDKSIDIFQRNRYADDNLEEVLENMYSDQIEECSTFTLQRLFIDDFKQNYLQLTFNDNYNLSNNDTLIIKRTSELIPLNYCPICGRQITKEGKTLDEYSYRI